MIIYFKLIIFIPFLFLSAYGQDEIFYQTRNNVLFMTAGDPPQRGYWEVDKNNSAVYYILPSLGPNYRMENQGTDTVFYTRAKTLFNNEFSLPSLALRMNKKNCTKIDLAKKLGPARNQVGGTCYAYVANDLLSYGEDRTYSALYLAQQNPLISSGASVPENIVNRITGFQGGDIQVMLKAAMKHGIPIAI